MITRLPYRLSCAAALAAAQFFAAPVFVSAAAAQAAPRVKAKLVAFDGRQMTLELLTPFRPLPARPVAGNTSPPKDETLPDKAPLTVAVLPDTRYVVTETSSFAALKTGEYAGAAVTQSRDGRLTAKDVYIYADALRGSGEGRFRDGDEVRINGSVSALQDAGMTLHYRGALVSSAGAGRTVCEGRALPPALVSPLACTGDAVIAVPADTPVSTLAIGDKSLLVPGALLSVSLAKNEAGESVTPGVVVEKAAGPPAGTPEKPQSSR